MLYKPFMGNPFMGNTHTQPMEAGELEQLASDMDVFGNGTIPLDEFVDVLFRRQRVCCKPNLWQRIHGAKPKPKS